MIKGDAVNSEYLVIEDLKKAIENFQSRAFDLYWDKTQDEKKKKKSDYSFLKNYLEGGLLENSKNAEKRKKYWENQVEKRDLAIKK